jgi:putative protease
MKKVELMAPAKNIKCIKAGLKYADSFYFGSKDLNMRMQSDNFSNEDLPRAVKLCHDNNIKTYLTTNVLVYNNELNELKDNISFAKSSGFDAVIVHDFAAIEYAKEIGIPFIVSTQANVSNIKAALHFETIGAHRIVLARECSFQQIKDIKQQLKKAEIEVFIHGAMCASISGRCYFSMDTCRSDEFSANRGRCVQPCRRMYRVIDEQNNEYIYDGVRFMNSRDLCLIEYIPELIEANIDAFKIEGRMRDPHYVDVITKTYRVAIDAYYRGEFSIEHKKQVGSWIYELKKEYNRGFTNGFLFKRATEEDQQHKSPTNLSHWRLIKLGIIEKMTKNEKRAMILLNNGFLKNGMDVVIEGSEGSETYFHQTIKNLDVNGDKSNSTRTGTESNPIEVLFDIDEPVNINRLDNVYFFTEKTYEHRESGEPKKRKDDYYKLYKKKSSAQSSRKETNRKDF